MAIGIIAKKIGMTRVFNEDGSVNEGSQKFLQGFMDTYVAWVKKHI